MSKFKSNIAVKSNIYIRTTGKEGYDDWQKDSDFVKNIFGKSALSKAKSAGGSFNPVRLSDVQKKELDANTNCFGGHNNGQPYGRVLKPNGSIVFECRCETTTCPYVSQCKPVNIIREKQKPITIIDDDEDLVYEWLGIKRNADIFTDDIIVAAEEQKDTYEETSESVEIKEDEYEKITSPEIIINSDLSDRILINAAPGTGKTYTAIKRLEHILGSNEIEDCSSILVLCYTRAAVNEINKRIIASIINKELPFEAKQVSVCTLDSLATNYLLDQIELERIKCNLNTLTYNERIKAFNSSFRKEDFESFKYVIIDEIQDLVHDRALMTLNIISALKCGYLLLGDRCQAIYDYDSGSSVHINSSEFYRRLENLIQPETAKYELIGNKRQADELAKRTELLRDVLLSGDLSKIKETFVNETKSIPVNEVKAENFSDTILQTTAILCRNNGEAEYVSWHLHKNNVPHNLLRNSAQPPLLSRWISDIFWDYRDKNISKDEFYDRFLIRTAKTAGEAMICWNSLCEVCYEKVQDYIECEILAKKLCRSGEFPESLCSIQHSLLTVSTIHKAKGREFDKVYLLGYDYSVNKNDDSEERIMYVGETRPKQELLLLKKGCHYNWRFGKSRNNRWIRKIIRRFKNPVLGNISIGYYDDTDYSAFVGGNLTDAVKRQEYIAENVNVGDNVELINDDGEFLIIHKNNEIGKASKNLLNSLEECIHDKNIPLYNYPDKIADLYISNIFTYVSYSAFDNIPKWFRDNRFWLGVEITGFGKTEWIKKEKNANV